MPKTKISTWRLLRNRVIAGLFVVLPVFITFYVIKWLYETSVSVLIGPIRNWLISIWYPSSTEGDAPVETVVEIAGTKYRMIPEGVIESGDSNWIISFLASLAAFALVIGLLFIAGMFFRSRLHRTVDWFLSNVPGVNTVYNAVSNVVEAISRTQSGTENFKRVVLVDFPHPGMKVPAFVTSDCRDKNTGRDILTVYVPTTPVPTSGYMLLVPSDEVTEVEWDLQETLQAIVSGGITVPENIIYDRPDRIEAPKIDPNKVTDKKASDKKS